MHLTDTDQIHLTWIYEGEHYIYEAVPRSIVRNTNENSLRFKLSEIDDKEENFEVVIQQKGDKFIFRADNYGDEGEDYLLKLFVADDELILYFDDDFDHGFFRLTK